MNDLQQTQGEQKGPFDPIAVVTKLWQRLGPKLQALIVVSVLGACGAWIGMRWQIKIGSGPLLDAINDKDVLLQIALGIAGACAAVFLLAKTDTNDLIHCAMIALFSGIAGPYLVVRGLQVVISDLKPGDVKAKTTAANVMAGQTAEVAKEVKAIADKKPDNPGTLVQAIGKATESTKSYLSVIQSLPKEEKERSLAENKDQMGKALDAIGSAAPQVTESFPQIKEVADQARNAGAKDIAEKAQQILSSNATENSKPAAQAAAKNALKSPLYFITPPTLTDASLGELQQQVLQKFPSLQFQSSVHPSKRMDEGVEVVYYKTGEDQQANDLLHFVGEYLSKKGIHVRSSSSKGTTDKSTEPSQFDIHLGPDIADVLAKQHTLVTPENSISPTPTPASTQPRKRARRRR